jgi:hypothetical protein
MKFKFLKDTDFLNNRNKNIPHFFKNPGLDLASWNDVISEIDIAIKNQLDMRIHDDGCFVLVEGHRIKYAGDLLAEYSKLNPSLKASAHAYIALSEKSWVLGRHNDSADVLFWQIIGSTEWTIECDNEKIVHVLTPGDLIYVPMGLYHDVKNLTPRVGVSFGLDYI